MSGRYQVVGECAFATVETMFGRAKTLLYKGAFLPDGCPELEHLLSTGLVARVDDGAGVGVNADGGLGPSQPSVAAGPDGGPDPDEQRRAEARAKLAELGGTPDGRSSEAVWVEYAVAQGLDRTEAEKAGKEELRKALAK